MSGASVVVNAGPSTEFEFYAATTLYALADANCALSDLRSGAAVLVP